MDISEVKSIVAEIELERETYRYAIKDLRYKIKKIDKRIKYLETHPMKYARDKGVGHLLVERDNHLHDIELFKKRIVKLSKLRRINARKLWKTK